MLYIFKTVKFPKNIAMPITSTIVPIDADSVGQRWIINDENKLARFVGLIAKSEFGHVEAILIGDPVDPISYTSGQIAEIKLNTIKALTVPKDPATMKEIDGPRKYHRDGFIFEAISWIVARMSSSPDALLRDPHIGATTQGLDGLMIELNAAKDDIIATTVFEDKCSGDARTIFRSQTLPALKLHHQESRKIIESAIPLLRQQFRAGAINAMAAKAIALNLRKYRSSLTILPSEDNQTDRVRIFKGYNGLAGITQNDRLGCTLITSTDIRDWFENFAQKVINTL
ncbi:hypothetical protein [Sphingobacterium multivorum]|uniref:hypothetical protein n=1 Tax=Sphingobacterium multivorum TaxID=28454 RepID=UPI0028A6C336|nr:hypothetical protein [Sphingobacterium multivorum]